MTDKIEHTDLGYEIAADVLCVPIIMVNICLVGIPTGGSEWFLVDAALWNSADRIIELAESRFGTGTAPKAIILTHGHFDHIGALSDLLKKWDVPIYAHENEIPYLTGKADYPSPDPSVDDGLMAKLSPLYPNESINLGNSIKPLPNDGCIPYAPKDWRWIHTPGHTEGHISLFRDKDRVLIAGDAFTTVEQESAIAVITRDKELHGPPKYFTTDWQAAWNSVRKLEKLNPSVVITGHGLPMRNPHLSAELEILVRDFKQIAIPKQGRYVDTDQHYY